MRYLKTLQSSSPQLKQKKDAITLGSAKDASADALPKGSPNIEEKGKVGLELSSLHFISGIHCLLFLFFISQLNDWMWRCTSCRVLLNLRISITVQRKLLTIAAAALHRVAL